MWNCDINIGPEILEGPRPPRQYVLSYKTQLRSQEVEVGKNILSSSPLLGEMIKLIGGELRREMPEIWGRSPNRYKTDAYCAITKLRQYSNNYSVFHWEEHSSMFVYIIYSISSRNASRQTMQTLIPQYCDLWLN